MNFVFESGRVCAHWCRYPQRPEVSAGPSGAGVLAGCKLPDLYAGNQAPVLRKSRSRLLTTEPPLQPRGSLFFTSGGSLGCSGSKEQCSP